MSNLFPFEIPNKLAGNPARSLLFPMELSLQPKGKDPLFLADPRATRAMIALMDMNAVLGGAASHYGGPAAFAELMSALFGCVFERAKKENRHWYELFNLVNDAGHCENGLYALKANYGVADLNLSDLRKFRSFGSQLTGHGEVHLFPETVFLSNGPLGSAFPQAQGLAMADAKMKRNRITVTAISDGACMEGEAREALAAIPGFAQLGRMAPFILIISDNNTKLSGRIDKDSFSLHPTFKSLEVLGWKVLPIEDGHDLSKCYEVISQAVRECLENPNLPIAIHAKTIKGYGTKKTAESSSGSHGFPLKSASELQSFISEIYEGLPFPNDFQIWINELMELEQSLKSKKIPSPSLVVSGAEATHLLQEEKIQNGVSSALIKLRKEGLPLISISSDLAGSTGVGGFRKEFPDDSIDVGVAESNMISVAAGFSKMGYIPVVDTFAQFGVTKGALPLMMASLSETPMICIFSHTGFQDAADGASHQALNYLSITCGIPQCDVYSLTCRDEAEALVSQAVKEFAQKRKDHQNPRTSIFFLGRENFPKTYNPQAIYSLNSAQIVKESSVLTPRSVTLVASGSLLREAIKAAHMAESMKLGTIVINPVCHNRIDFDTIEVALAKTGGRILIVEDHQIVGGLGQMISSGLSLRASYHLEAPQFKSLQVKILGVSQDRWGQSAYTADELYQVHHLDAQSIFQTLTQFL